MSDHHHHRTPTVDLVPIPSPFPTSEGGMDAAYERQLPAILAVRDHELAVLNIDPRGAVTTVLGALKNIEPLRGLIRGLPHIDQSLIDDLEDYAWAASEALSRHATDARPEKQILALKEQALERIQTFRLDATALAHRGLIEPARLASFTGQVGYEDVAFELIDYANLMRDCWPRIQGRTAITVEEVQEAKLLGEQLAQAAGQRKQTAARVVVTARIRQQALTLLFKAYSQTRRAVAFLRWNEGDVDNIAPSLYAGRGGRGKAQTSAIAASGTPEPTHPTPAPSPARGEHTNGHSALVPIAAGLPGASPFVQ